MDSVEKRLRDWQNNPQNWTPVYPMEKAENPGPVIKEVHPRGYYLKLFKLYNQETADRPIPESVKKWQEKWQFYTHQLESAENLLRTAINEFKNFKDLVARTRYEHPIQGRHQYLKTRSLYDIHMAVEAGRVKKKFYAMKAQFYRAKVMVSIKAINSKKDLNYSFLAIPLWPTLRIQKCPGRLSHCQIGKRHKALLRSKTSVF